MQKMVLSSYSICPKVIFLLDAKNYCLVRHVEQKCICNIETCNFFKYANYLFELPLTNVILAYSHISSFYVPFAFLFK